MKKEKGNENNKKNPRTQKRKEKEKIFL